MGTSKRVRGALNKVITIVALLLQGGAPLLY